MPDLQVPILRRGAAIAVLFLLVASCGSDDDARVQSDPSVRSRATPAAPVAARKPVATIATTAPPRTPTPTSPPTAATPSDPDGIAYIAGTAALPARWDPCRTIRYRINPADAPAGGIAMIRQAIGRAAAVTGLTFVDNGTTAATLVPGVFDPTAAGFELIIGWTKGGYFAGNHSLLFLTRVVPAKDGNPRIDGAQIILNAATTAPMAFTGGPRSTWGWGTCMLYRMGNVVNISSISAKDQIMSRQNPNAPKDYGAADRSALSSLGASKGCLPDA